MMNIIISSLNTDGLKITGSDTDIDLAKLFIAKDLNITPLRIELSTVKTEDGLTSTITYPLSIIESLSLNKDLFNGYELSAKTSIPLDSYNIKFYIQGQDNPIVFATLLNIENGLVDEHEPVYIIGRQINPVKTQIVAQDVNSQQICFYIKKRYDGISFLDDSKQVYVDYIPVDKSLLVDEDGNVIAFLSDAILEIEDDPDPIDQEGDWLLLRWNVPPAATKLAGSVTFGISVLNNFNNQELIDYCWQTFPSTFTVSKNIGLRSIPVASAEELSQFTTLINEVADIRSDVNALEAFVGNQTDEDLNNDVEVIIGGGGADSI